MTGTPASTAPTSAGSALPASASPDSPRPDLIPLPGSRPKVDGPVRGKLYIKTHGCQMNEYDSSKMADVLAAAEGLELTDDPAEADVLLMNTCSIREKAQEKVFSQLGTGRR